MPAGHFRDGHDRLPPPSLEMPPVSADSNLVACGPLRTPCPAVLTSSAAEQSIGKRYVADRDPRR